MKRSLPCKEEQGLDTEIRPLLMQILRGDIFPPLSSKAFSNKKRKTRPKVIDDLSGLISYAMRLPQGTDQSLCSKIMPPKKYLG